MMRRFASLLKSIFFWTRSKSIWLLPITIAAWSVVIVGVVYGGSEAWSYTSSPQFCGTTCHTMPPQYSAYQHSPHSRVQCVECHIGRDAFTTQFTRKAGDLRHVVLTLTQNYEYPIHSRAMRPARDTCERCHSPEKFSDDSLREVQHYATDEANTRQSTYLLMKTGGGTQREGLGQGIHWHIENEVWYLANDELEQQIPYVRVIDGSGDIQEYYDVGSGIGPEDVAGSYLERMDCLNCHNRITHRIADPEDAVDNALFKGLIAADLPYVRRQSVELLRKEYPSQEAALANIATLADYYEQNYPQLAAERSVDIDVAVGVLQDIYRISVFPDQKIDWDTHPDNLGHERDPGCFRCHDGKHLSGTGEAIRLECNLCHSIPIRVDNDDLVTTIELPRGPEPPSHTHSSWIALHGRAIDATCAACHPPPDNSIDYTKLEGTPPADESFCGNVACHSNEWQFAGFDDPALESVLDRQLYILLTTSPFLLEGQPRTYDATFKALFDGRCIYCHSGDNAEAGLDLSSYETMIRGSADGPIVLSDDPEASPLLLEQSGTTKHFGQVLDDELIALTEWIAAGAPER
ncbi:MAG: NapC/NirT family cytochrome c [Anaerolineae bacterium]|nr:NapC/NirT family cytochrome c [Anaerolineae bacterium]